MLVQLIQKVNMSEVTVINLLVVIVKLLTKRSDTVMTTHYFLRVFHSSVSDLLIN